MRRDLDQATRDIKAGGAGGLHVWGMDKMEAATDGASGGQAGGKGVDKGNIGRDECCGCVGYGN